VDTTGAQVARNVGTRAPTTEAISTGFSAVTGGATVGSRAVFAGVMPHRVIEVTHNWLELANLHSGRMRPEPAEPSATNRDERRTGHVGTRHCP